MGKRVQSLKTLLKRPWRHRPVMSVKALQKALSVRPEYYRSNPSYQTASPSGVRLNAYGELLDEPENKGPMFNSTESPGPKYGAKYEKHGEEPGKYSEPGYSVIGNLADVEPGGRFSRTKEGRLAKIARRVLGSVTIISLLGGLFFASPNMSGGAIGIADFSQDSSNIIGTCLIAIGFICSFFYFMKR